tara:strand:- start:162 stop:464 length:303 start_codon:yes stop_codon:yes gene_type:complete
MAKYIKIKKENIDIPNNAGVSAILLGDIVSVHLGIANGTTADNNSVTLYNSIGKSIVLTVTAAASDWTKDLQYALTANPGGIMAIVHPSSSVKVTGMAIA